MTNPHPPRWPKHRPEIGSRFYVTWRNSSGTVVALPYGTGVKMQLDSGITISMSGNDWSEAVEDGSVKQILEDNQK